MASNGKDISLKMNMDVSDAERALEQFDKSVNKAFKSSETKTQSLGNSLNKVTQSIRSTIAEMRRMETTKVPTEQYTALQSKLDTIKAKASVAEKELEKMGKQRLYTTEYAGATDAVRDFATMAEKARTELGRLTIMGGSESRIKEVKADLQMYENELKRAVQIQTQLESEGRKYEQNDAYDRQAQKLQTYQNVIASTTQQLRIMQTTGSGFTTEAQANPEKYNKLAQNIGNATNQAGVFVNKINEAEGNSNKLNNTWKRIGSTIKKAVTKAGSLIGNVFKRNVSDTASSHNKSFKQMLTTVLKYGFGIRSIFLLYKKLRTVIATGLGEMAKQFSDVAEDVYNLKNSFSGFKASLASAFQPIFSYVVPALATMINYLTTAMNAVANFFAILTGQGYYYKAKKGIASVNSGIGGTGSAAKEANEELAEYDELIVINQDKGGSGGGGGGAGGGSEDWQWEKVDVTASNLADKLGDIWEVFKKAWEKKGKAVIDAATYALNSIKEAVRNVAQTIYQVFIDGYGETWLVSVLSIVELILNIVGDIGTSFNEAWTKDNNGYNLVKSFFEMLTSINDTIVHIGESWRKAWNSELGTSIIEHVLHIVTNINETIKYISDNFRRAWDEGGRGDEIMQNILIIVDKVLGIIERLTEKTKQWAKQLDFAPLLDSILTFLQKIQPLIDAVGELIEVIWTKYILPLIQKFIEKYLPRLLDIVGRISEDLAPIVDDVAELLDTLSPLWDMAVDVLLDSILDLLDDMEWALDGITTVLDPLLQIINDVLKALGVDNPNGGFNQVVKLIMQTQNPISGVGMGILGIVQPLKGLIASFKTLWASIKAIFSPLVNWFKEKFQLAYDKIVEVFGPIVDWFKEKWEAIKEFFHIDELTAGLEKLGLGGGSSGTDSGLKITNPFSSAVNKVTSMTIDTKMTGAVTSTKGFENLNSNVTTFNNNYKSKSSTYTTNMSGSAKSSKDVSGLSSVFASLNNSITSKSATYSTSMKGTATKSKDLDTLSTKYSSLSASIKSKSATYNTTMTGSATKSSDLDGLSTKYGSLYNSMKSKSATYTTYMSGQAKNSIGLDNLRTKYSGVYNTWTDRTSTLSTNTGGSLTSIKELATWQNYYVRLFDIWRSKSATFTTVMNGTIRSLDALTQWANRINTLYTYWKGRQAQYTISFNSSLSLVTDWTNRINTLYTYWRGRSATFSLTFSAATGDLRNWVNQNVIQKINQAFSRTPVLRNQRVPYLAKGGIVSSETLFVAGENGQEAVVPLEKNLGWLDKMANMISDKLADTQVPLIAQGNILPMSEAFMNSATALIDNSNVAKLLQEILDRLATLETNNGSDTIELNLDGRTVAQVVWDESEKRYKQTGIRYAY